jgi:hypothetical protein
VSFFEPFICTVTQFTGQQGTGVVPVTVVVPKGDAWNKRRGQQAKMALPKHKLRLIKAFLEAECIE